jgi:hypothetical protein
MQVNSKVRSGNRINVLLDNKKVGLIQNVRMNDDYSPDAASGVGDIHVQEYVPTMARHSLSVSTMVLKASSLRQAGISMENGDAVLKGLVFDFQVQDIDSGAVLRTYRGCSFASGDTEVAKHAIMMSNGQFLALDVDGTAV